MTHLYAIAATALRRYTKRQKDEGYLRFIRTFPCVGCGFSGSYRRKIEAAHIGPHSFSSKSDDCTALPLCPECHQHGKNALHKVGPEQFQILHGIEFPALQALFNWWYFQKSGKWAKGWEVEQERRKAA